MKRRLLLTSALLTALTDDGPRTLALLQCTHDVCRGTMVLAGGVWTVDDTSVVRLTSATLPTDSAGVIFGLRARSPRTYLVARTPSESFRARLPSAPIALELVWREV